MRELICGQMMLSDPRSQQEKNLQLEAENRTLLGHAQELSLQNERIRTVVGE